MNIDESVFAYKLYEMEEQYGKLQCRIRTCERGGRNKIHSELERAREEYAENSLLLEEKARSCRSPAVARLTQVQLDYRRKVEELKSGNALRGVCNGFCHACHAAGADLRPERA